MVRPRPQAITTTDELLVHVLDALDAIRDRLPEPKKNDRAGQTDVSEPGKPAAKRAARVAEPKQTKTKEAS